VKNLKLVFSILVMVVGIVGAIVLPIYMLVTGITGAMEGWQTSNYSLFGWRLARAILFEMGSIPGIITAWIGYFILIIKS
jgi:hypothetical protein